ncbi:MAG: hypothetical protein P1P65_00840 [Treponema sp.]
MGKKQDGNKQSNYKQIPLNGMAIADCVCSGEMFIGDEAADLIAKIPLNPMATPEMIKELKHEKEPLDCVFIVDYRKSKSGVEYLDSAYESIVNQILTAPKTFVPCGYGHQSQEAVKYEGRKLYGTVIGALIDKAAGKVYYRIIPDKGDDAKDIRRWLKNKQIGAVSIWGFPTYTDSSRTVVADYMLLSVDFVPPFTEGQHNSMVAGQMHSMGHNELNDKLSHALQEKYPDYLYTNDVFDDFLITEYKSAYYKIPYSMENDTVILGAAEKVSRTVKYEKLEEAMDLTQVTNDELLTEMGRRTKGGLLSSEKAAGEMGLHLEDAGRIKELEAAKNELDSLKQAAGEMSLSDAVSIAKKAKEAELRAAEEKAFGEMVDAVKAEKGLLKDGKPAGEMAVLVDKFAHLEVGMTREQVAGEMARVIDDPDINAMIQAKTGAAPVGEVGQKTGSKERKVYEI